MQLVFDLDGVLINSGVANAAAFSEGLKEVGIKVESDAITSLIGRHAREILMVLGCPEERVQEILEEVVKPYYQSHLELLELMPGAKVLLQALAEKEIPMRACTSGDWATQERILSHFQIIDYFDKIHTPCHSRTGKPDPQFLAEALEGVSKDETVWMVEDSPVGLAMIHDYGATSVFARYGFGQIQEVSPDYQIDQPLDLLPLLDGENA